MSDGGETGNVSTPRWLLQPGNKKAATLLNQQIWQVYGWNLITKKERKRKNTSDQKYDTFSSTLDAIVRERYNFYAKFQQDLIIKNG